MIDFKIEDDVIHMPTKWSEVSVSHFIKPEFLSGDALGLLSALSGIPINKLANTTVDLTDKFEQGVKFIKDNPNGWKGTGVVPETITVLDVVCKIPVDLEMKMMGQKIMLTQELTKHKYFYSSIPESVAIYLAPQIYPDDWYERIPEVAEAIRLLPIHSIYPIADFFLTSIEVSPKNGIQS